MLISCPLRQAVIASPDSCAIRDEHRLLTFAELDRLAALYADDLTGRGLSPGRFVGILSDNSIEYAALLIALMRCRAVAVPLNTRLNSVELHRQTTQIDLTLMLADDTNLSKASEIHSQPTPMSSLSDPRPSARNDFTPTELEMDRSCFVVFTSGSSGSPKGVILSLGNLYYNALGANENIPLHPEDTWLLSLPLFHVGGLGIMFRCLLAGAKMFVARRFEAGEVGRLIDSGGITHVSLVPTMLIRLLQERSNRPFPAALKVILLGGAPVSANLLQAIRSMNIPAVISYGMTETASQITATRLTDSPERLVTSGRVLRHCEIRIESESASKIGEICVRGEVVCRGYTAAADYAVADGGWLHTGDIGTLDNDGYLTVLGRKDGMFISGGENIFPEEIESVAASLAGVTAAAVMPVEDPLWGKRPLLFIECRPGSAVDKEQIFSYLSSQLAKFKLPDRIIIVEKLPRTALDKIDRTALARLAESPEG